MTTSGAVCSDSYCNLHDVGMSIWDEDGKRPENRRRNPWDGFCLRIQALKKIGEAEAYKRVELLPEIEPAVTAPPPRRPRPTPPPPPPPGTNKPGMEYTWKS